MNIRPEVLALAHKAEVHVMTATGILVAASQYIAKNYAGGIVSPTGNQEMHIYLQKILIHPDRQAGLLAECGYWEDCRPKPFRVYDWSYWAGGSDRAVLDRITRRATRLIGETEELSEYMHLPSRSLDAWESFEAAWPVSGTKDPQKGQAFALLHQYCQDIRFDCGKVVRGASDYAKWVRRHKISNRHQLSMAEWLHKSKWEIDWNSEPDPSRPEKPTQTAIDLLPRLLGLDPPTKLRVRE